MASDDEFLNAAVGYGFGFMFNHRRRNFINETKPDYEFVSAYYDPQDGLPVVVLKIRTNECVRNHAGEVHPGAFCLMVDYVTTYAALTDLKWYKFTDNKPENVQLLWEEVPKMFREMGISRSIRTHRNRPIKAGSTIYIASKLMENTPSSSFTICTVYSEDGELLATGQHDKTKLRKAVVAKI